VEAPTGGDPAGGGSPKPTPPEPDPEGEPGDDETPIEGEEQLRDAGKKALDSMKSKWKDEVAARKKAEAELSALKAAADGREAEHKAELEAQRIKDEALSAANKRILTAELRAAAKGALTNAEDALVFIDLDEFEVGDDGSVDTDAIDSAVKKLLEERPYLAAQGERRFTGDVGQGVRNAGKDPTQLTRADLARMTHTQIEEARKAGRLKDLLGK
jgi:hypothetical protein